MGLGQMLMALLATVLLSTFILNMNRNSFVMENSINEYKVKELAINLAQSVVDAAQCKRFDTRVTGYTAVGSLGIEDAGENANNYSTFNDFDDFNSYINTVNSDTVGFYSKEGKDSQPISYRIRCFVRYVDYTNLNLPVNYTTNYKRLEVRVWSDACLNPITEVPDTIKLFTICGDWTNP